MADEVGTLSLRIDVSSIVLATILAVCALGPSSIRLEAILAKPTFKLGERIRIDIFAVNDSDREVVVGKSALGNYASGRMDGKVFSAGTYQPELNHYNPNRGQIMSGSILSIQEDEFAVIPPKSRTLVFFEEIAGEWKDGYTPWNAPQGIKAITIPLRSGDYKFSYTYSFNRKDSEKRLKAAAFQPGMRLGDYQSPDIHRKVVFEGQSRTLFDTAIEGRWTVTGSFKIDK